MICIQEQDQSIIAKNLLLEGSCNNCTYMKKDIINSDGMFLTEQKQCFNPEILKDENVKWISKCIPSEEICEWWEKK